MPAFSIDIPLYFFPLIAFIISFFTSLGGVSGAFLLLPFQVSVLGFDSPAVSPTNLVYNIIAIPSGVYRYIREGRMLWPLALIITLGTLPGVCIGAFIRIRYLPDPVLFSLFVGCVLLYIGIQLLYQTVKRPHRRPDAPGSGRNAPDAAWNAGTLKTLSVTFSGCTFEFRNERYSFSTYGLAVITFFVGVVGGTYGVGGGSIIAPFCIALLGLPVYVVAGAALFGTFVTSIAGVLIYHLLAHWYQTPDMLIAPDWRLGILFGTGGLVGMYCGARIQKYIKETLIKFILSALILMLSIRYIYTSLGVIVPM